MMSLPAGAPIVLDPIAQEREGVAKLAFEVVNPLEHDRWDETVLSIEGNSCFHSSAWVRVLEESYGYTPWYFMLFRNRKPKGVIPFMEIASFLTGRRGVSLPFSDQCEPLVDDRQEFDFLWENIVRFGRERRWSCIELRGGSHLLPEMQGSQEYLVHEALLPKDESALLNSFRSSTRRNINKARAEGVVATVVGSEALRQFQRLNAMTRRRHGIPPQPDRFFRKVAEHIIAPEKGFIVQASHGKEVVAAAVFFLFGDAIYYKYGASDEHYQHLRANNLVMWEAMRWGCRHGYRRFSFGRTDPDNEGLRQFKDGWGTTSATLSYFRYEMGTGRFVQRSPATALPCQRIVRKLPLPLLQAMGSLTYRHLG